MCLLLCVSGIACKSGPDDAAITTAVKAKLIADAGLKGFKIDVDTKEGAVSLSGTVETEAAKASAESIAKATEGVKSVKNNLIIKPPAPPVIAVDTSNDAAIKKAIEDKLKAGNLSTVTVDVVGGVATLKGSVPKGSLIKAMQAANEATPKPKSAKNEITEK